MDIRLLVSLSGIQNSRQLDDIVGELDRRDVPVTYLLRPRACVRTSPVAAWAQHRIDRGDSVLLHGYDHNTAPRQQIWPVKRAEFSGLSAFEASLRLRAARAQLEHSNLRIDGFAPPRWLASYGTLSVLRGHGFRLCATETGIHDLHTTYSHRARVHMLPSPEDRAEALRLFGFIHSVARDVRRDSLIRIGADATDLGFPGQRQAFLDAVDLALEADATPISYGALLKAEAHPPLWATRSA